MALLPRPYPDEAIGSVIARGVWHTGLPLKTLLQSLFGPTKSCSSLLMGTSFSELSLATGMAAEELMRSHTVFPYATAFMPLSAKTELMTKALNPRLGEDCLGSLTKSVSHGVPFRRLCPLCVKEEMATYGESYWHRQHLLPGTLVCLTHGVALVSTDIPLRGRTQNRDWLLPHMVSHRPIQTAVSVSALTQVAELSYEALRGKSASDNLLSTYRTRALELGYRLTSGQVASVAISKRLQVIYGQDFLADSGCTLARQAWPSLMLRPTSKVPFAPAKHVLLQTFLELDGGAPDTLASEYEKPGKKTTDYKRLDSELTLRMKTVLNRAKAKSRRMTVRELLTEAGSWGAFKHHRSEMPKAEELVMQFRESDQAERQIGGREIWRMRHPARFRK